MTEWSQAQGDAGWHLIHGDALQVLPTLETGSVRACITSPPYFGLRDYGVDGQVGLERTPDEYVAKLVAVFREVWRVLKDDGTLWLNLGDCYAGMKGASGYELPHEAEERRGKGQTIQRAHNAPGYRKVRPQDDRAALRGAGLKAKDLIGIPWRVALALQADGWYLRSDIIWHKPNPMPESVTDRPTKAHEYLFLLTKQEKYYYNAEAVREPTSPSSDFGRVRPDAPMPSAVHRRLTRLGNGSVGSPDGRNRRTVWTIATTPYSGAHFAVMPPKLVEPCILAGSRPGDLILDPFVGSGTVGAVALENERCFVGIDLNADYLGLAQDRLEAASQQLRMAV